MGTRQNSGVDQDSDGQPGGTPAPGRSAADHTPDTPTGQATTGQATTGQAPTGQTTTTRPRRPDPTQDKYRDLCSVLTDELLPGTAKRADLVLALEYAGPWSHDILDGDTLDPELSRRIRSFAKSHRAGIHFIRKPGRAGRRRTGSTLFIAHARAGVLERLTLDGPEDLPDLELGGPGETPGAERVTAPVMLVCTHGKRDRCCAVFGRPVAAALEHAFPLDQVWESSHTKGHRLAPSMVLLPSNHSFGRLTAPQAATVLGQATRGELPVLGNRGRGTLDAAGQVAELAVAQAVVDAGRTVGLTGLDVREPSADGDGPGAGPGGPGEGTTAPSATRASDPGEAEWRVVTETSTGRTWEVGMTRTEVGPVVSSCGGTPKTTTAWTATTVREL
ncbi:sucrase ferredoxin [Corynebacterium bovis]|uniref:sucrase ferredoxin n=1 Tax=Corynebacterium bovis TaxID=36808 RepID=UPI000F652B4E|nr:sucrase ferredoxin [Corynebacterium bovis]RRO92102.1 sucrase ferredoxin [Corynebacterium bovis]RRQ00639.1 sucrase ferredoxin [Corynebacterium bovis]RRQ00928.1 sucrase ferredoxin [Corynebacterium bovis]